MNHPGHIHLMNYIIKNYYYKLLGSSEKMCHIVHYILFYVILKKVFKSLRLNLLNAAETARKS